MAKRIYFDAEARQGLAAGITLMADTVRPTLGPRGRRVALARRFMAPIFSNDGSSIATEFILEDKLANIGVQLFRKVANQMEGDIGDGTTTTILLAGELVKGGLRLLAGGAEARALAAGLRAAAVAATQAITDDSCPLSAAGPNALRQVALMAAHDETIANLVAEAFAKVGEFGLIEVEPSQAVRSWVEVVAGMVFDQGYITPRLIPGKDGGAVDLKAPFVMVMEGNVTNGDDLVPALELVKQRAIPLLLVAEEVSGEALSTLIINNVRGITRAYAVRAPGFGGERSRHMLADLAAITGAEVLTPVRGYRPEQFHEGMLGRVARAWITDQRTRLIGGAGDAAVRETRANALRKELAGTRDDYVRDTLERRIGWLSGGVAILRPGCNSTSHIRETRFRANHGLAAVRAALADGVVTGGGLAYLHGARSAAVLAADLTKQVAAHPLGADFARQMAENRAAGARLLATALPMPLRQMADNAGLNGGQVVQQALELPPGQGLDLQTMTWGDLREQGIVDPTQVVIQAIQKAVSLANLVLESNAVVVDMDPLPDLGK